MGGTCNPPHCQTHGFLREAVQKGAQEGSVLGEHQAEVLLFPFFSPTLLRSLLQPSWLNGILGEG